MIPYQISKENMLCALLDCENYRLDEFLHLLIMKNISPREIINKARNMGLEPINLDALTEALKTIDTE